MEKNSEAFITTKIKKETPDETIKEYAESAMNELLAWYGYGSAHETPKLSSSCHSQQESNSSEPGSPKTLEECEWCGKQINDTTPIMSSKTTFCSELCFSQSRRANFKKNRTCDWCKHLRHTVSYVDFQDGASQLQFCSDKCLNQYKMHIFCRETRAHLELHPHITENSDLGGSLITPELWLKNCKSPEHSNSTPNSPRGSDNTEQSSPLPLITTHSVKPENVRPNKRIKNKCQRKHSRASSNVSHASIRTSPISEAPQDLRIRQTPNTNKFESVHFKEEYSDIHNPFIKEFQNRFPNIHRTLPEKHPAFPPFGFGENQTQFSKPLPIENLMPPVTVLVPYPIIIPVPLPIPIPIPINSNSLDLLSNASKEPFAVSEKNSQENNNKGVQKDIEEIKIETKEDCPGDENEITQNLKENKQETETSSPKKRKLLFTQKCETTLVKKKKYPIL